MHLKEQITYVKKIVGSCKTEEQKTVATNWAEKWAKRTQKIFPNVIDNWVDLFIEVMQVDCACSTGKVVKSHNSKCSYMNEIFGEDVGER